MRPSASNRFPLRQGARGAEKPASKILREIEAKAAAASDERVVVGELLRGAGARLYGLALVLFALPEAIPFPAVGLTGLIAIPVAVVSVTMLIWGAGGELPDWIRRRSVKRDWILRAAPRGIRLVLRLERFSYPRLSYWTEFGRPLGLLCLALSVVMAIPLPFSNVAPGVTVVVIGLGMFQRDGVLVLAGVFAATVILSLVVVLSLLVLAGLR